MKNSFLWVFICIICLCILLLIGRLIFNHMTLISDSLTGFINFEDREYTLWEERKLREIPINKNLVIYIDLDLKLLELIDLNNNEVIKEYIIAIGKKETPSPIGSFRIINKAKWGKAFGTRWLGLNVPWGKYGIHGTDKPNTIGWSASHGCIRMKNEDVEELFGIVKIGTPVNIVGGPFGPFGNGFRILKPGDRGSDVYEVQRRLKLKGYYPYFIDGIYGEHMKRYVIKFRRDNGMTLTHNIDYNFYHKLGIHLFE